MKIKLMTHFKPFAIGALTAALGAGTYVIAAITFSDFTPGTTISASEMNAKLNALKDRVNALDTLLAGVTRTTLNGQPAIRFSGVNVQIVSGAGTTIAAPNGTGNLIVGYDEVRPSGFPLQCSVGVNPGTGIPVPFDDAAACTAAGGVLALNHKSGSHMVVVGDQHNYSKFGGIVVGFTNASTNQYASVSGGQFNVAGGDRSSVSGGSGNAANGGSSSVSGGQGNRANFSNDSVSGGTNNIADGGNASVSGGANNTANGTGSSVSGGLNNIAAAANDSVSGGNGCDTSTALVGGARWRVGQMTVPGCSSITINSGP